MLACQVMISSLFPLMTIDRRFSSSSFIPIKVLSLDLL